MLVNNYGLLDKEIVQYFGRLVKITILAKKMIENLRLE
jgi:hypothetical protein